MERYTLFQELVGPVERKLYDLKPSYRLPHEA